MHSVLAVLNVLNVLHVLHTCASCALYAHGRIVGLLGLVLCYDPILSHPVERDLGGDGRGQFFFHLKTKSVSIFL